MISTQNHQYTLNQWVYLHTLLQQIVLQFTTILGLIPQMHNNTVKNKNTKIDWPLTSGCVD